MIIVKKCSLTEDRFGNPDSAILIELGGYATLPSGIYFDPETGGFTFMLWIKLLSLNAWQPIIDIGSGQNEDNIMLRFKSITILNANIVNDNIHKKLDSPTDNLEQVWTHIALSVEGFTVNIYINGELSRSQTGFPYRKIERTSNFIGRNNWGQEIHAMLDDLKIFNKSLIRLKFRAK